MKVIITESQYKKVLIREFGEMEDDPKKWYHKILKSGIIKFLNGLTVIGVDLSLVVTLMKLSHMMIRVSI
jgi:hypothetical protein